MDYLILGFVLSDAGFDVWLYNTRGVGLSRTLSIYKRPGSLPNMNRISWNFRYILFIMLYIVKLYKYYSIIVLLNFLLIIL